MTTEAGVEVMRPQPWDTKEHWKPPEAGIGRREPPSSFWRECGPANTLLLVF